MNRFRRSLVVLALVVPLMTILAYRVDSAVPGPRVSEQKNKHNLSAGYYDADTKAFVAGRDNSINYKATDDPVNNPAGRQICIFCHTPHNANTESPAPLWNRKLSTQTFSRYSSATLQIRVNPTVSSLAQYDQPDGASRLCLSCHDGVSNLGAVLRGAPATGIAMDAVNGGVITTIASFNPTTNKMKFGHHPVSFVYNGGIVSSVQYQISTARPGQGFRLPSQSLYASKVKLDKNNKMQCTTCHDAHQNQSDDAMCYDTAGTGVVECNPGLNITRKVVPFWVLHKQDVPNAVTDDHDAVCTSCHNMTQANPTATPPTSTVPWPTP